MNSSSSQDFRYRPHDLSLQHESLSRTAQKKVIYVHGSGLSNFTSRFLRFTRAATRISAFLRSIMAGCTSSTNTGRLSGVHLFVLAGNIRPKRRESPSQGYYGTSDGHFAKLSGNGWGIFLWGSLILLTGFLRIVQSLRAIIHPCHIALLHHHRNSLAEFLPLGFPSFPRTSAMSGLLEA